MLLRYHAAADCSNRLPHPTAPTRPRDGPSGPHQPPEDRIAGNDGLLSWRCGEQSPMRSGRTAAGMKNEVIDGEVRGNDILESDAVIAAQREQGVRRICRACRRMGRKP